MKLQFKEDHPLLPDNYHQSKCRRISPLSLLKSKPSVLKQYDETIQDQLHKGVIEPVDIRNPAELGRTHFLPHHEVIRSDKLTLKLRVMYDASARAERSQPSLNDCLYSGLSMTPLVLDVLLRFRAYPVALTAEISQYFS